MEKTYIFGHRKPDTDSVCASISMSYLKNKLGMDSEPRVLGNINNETRYVLDYFDVDEPAYLNDVKVQVKDINFKKNILLDGDVSIDNAFHFMINHESTALPLVNKDRKLNGLITLKEVSKELITGDINKLYTSYLNIVDSLEGKEILKFDEEIDGNLLIAAFKSESFLNNVALNNNTILIVGDRFNIIKKALSNPIKMLIIVGGYELKEDMLNLAKQNRVNIIYTNKDTYTTATKIRLANYAKNININTHPVTFYSNDYRTEILDQINKCGHTNYPILDSQNHCLGLLKVTDTNTYRRQNVILVDHNQKSQSVEGLDEANILEIIDHHNLGTIGTATPISFRSMPVGCTCTIIYKLYEEAGIKIPKNIAGLMLSAILSDTMIFKSPTTTSMDKKVAQELAEITNLDIESYGYEMFKAGSTIKGMSVEEVLNQDMKSYKVGDTSMVISQVFTMDYDDIEKDLDKYIDLLDNLAQNNHKVAVMFVTDVIKNGSYLIYNRNAEEIVQDSFNIKNIKQGTYLENIVSRKKQMVPNLMENIEKVI